MIATAPERGGAILRAAERAHLRERTVERAIVWGGRAGLIAVFLIVWQLAAGHLMDAQFISRPTAVVAAWWDLARSGILWANTQVTLLEVVVGFVCGALLGTLAACCFTVTDELYRVVEPYVLVIYSIPLVVLGPLLALWFGIGIMPKIILAAVGTGLLVFMNTVAGIRATDARLASLLSIMGASRFDVYRQLKIRHALPYTFTSLQLAIPIAVFGAVLGEFLGSSSGLGNIIEDEANFLSVDKMMAGIVTLGILVFVLRLLVAPLERWFSSYKSR